VGPDIDSVEYRLNLDGKEIILIYPKACGSKISYSDLSDRNSWNRRRSCSFLKLLGVGLYKS
jgi:hypothetical protein